MEKGDIVTLCGTVEAVREDTEVWVKVKIDDNPHGVWVKEEYIKTLRPMNGKTL